ncbi:MAG: hypothetical protein SWO11_18125 [Thermodesulfobacteriota bacterium]|nr:hypothetical protein [Thermodesulfobacteriota bacterium]
MGHNLYFFFLIVLIISIKLKKVKIIFSGIFCLVLFSYLGWIVNHYYLPDLYAPVSLFADAGIFIFTSFLFWILLSVKQETIQHIVKRKIIRILAIAMVLTLFFFNTAVIIDSYTIQPEGPNIILISIDTLRADHLGCYGYELNSDFRTAM